MALSTRELYLILRARDEASRVLRSVAGSIRGLDQQVAAAAQRNIQHGMAMTTVGLAVAGAGVVAIQALNNMTNAASDYNQQSAKTLTQVDGLTVSLEQLKDMGREIAREIPVPFETVQDTLYDIFSSMEVNVGQASRLAKQFSKDAVGGAVDVQTAGRAAITVLNAWKLPIEDVSKVSDVFFQLVRKGVGTYEEFTSTIGRSIPSAVKAGQSIEDLAGMLAFLTRNGLSTAMSATSAARALDAIARPATIARLEKMGITVRDASGEFVPMVDIMEQMREKFGDMTKPERAAALQELFKGSGGTIQAMRFFNLAMDDSIGLLDELTGNMHNAGGAAEQAYKIMANTPEAKTQMLKNQYEAMRTEVGDRLLPAKIKLVEWLTKLLDMWAKLSPKTKDMVVKVAALAAGVATLVGVVTAAAGIFLMLKGTLSIAGLSFAAVATPILLIVAGVTALGVAIFLLIKHWDTVSGALKRAWDVFMGFAKGPLDVIRVKIWIAWQAIKRFVEVLKDDLLPVAKEAWDAIREAVSNMWDKIRPAFDGFSAVIYQIIGIVSDLAEIFWNILKPAIEVIKALFMAAFIVIKNVVGPVFAFIGDLIYNLVTIFKNFVGLIWALLNGDWKKAWDFGLGLLKAFVKLFKDILSGAWDVVKGIFKAAIDIVVKILGDAWDWIGESAGELWDGVTQIFEDAWDGLKSLTRDAIRTVVLFFIDMAIKVVDAAEWAFGWIPGIGPKLRDAQQGIRNFRDDVNRSLGGIQDKKSTVGITFSSNAARLAYDLRHQGFASGGAVYGRGGPTSDANLAWVSRGEHIWTAKEVAAAGGHQQVELMRKQAVKGFAVGGPVGPVNLSKLPKVASNHFRDVNAAATDYVGNYAKSVVDKVRSAFEDIFQAAASGKGGWAFPLPRGSFSIGRGPVGHGYPAYDFPAPIGTPIYASRAGVVSRAMRLTTSYGIHAFINHLGGWQSRYAHMSQMFVRAGQFVKQLAMIGRVGSTGNSTGPHLHYENLLNGIRKSPRGVLFDHGNWIVPGWNAMYNATGQSEFLTPTVGGKGGPEKYIHQEITVHTQEIDPRRHAAEMGWELAVRV